MKGISSRTPLNIGPSKKRYRFVSNQVNEITYYFLKPIDYSTPGILLAIRYSHPQPVTDANSNQFFRRLRLRWTLGQGLSPYCEFDLISC